MPHDDDPQVNSSVRLFADDCLLYRPIKSATDQIQLQHDLNAVSSWADTWGMHFNPAKCYIMSTCPNRAFGPHLYSLCGSVLSKYLGITISEDLQWHEHVATTSAKANKVLGFLRRNLCGCPKDLKQLAYFSLIRSKLEYACVVWDPYLVKDKEILDKVQRRGARFVTNNYNRDSSVSAMIEELKWDPLEDRRRKSRVNIMNTIVSGRVAINILV